MEHREALLSPVSGQPLQPYDFGSLVLWLCPATGGAWLDNAAGRVLATTQWGERELGALAQLEAGVGPQSTGEGYRRAAAPTDRLCPECRAPLRQLRYKNDPGDIDDFSVILDVCDAHGTWFDRGEIARMERLQQMRHQLRSEVHHREMAAFQRALRPTEYRDRHGNVRDGALWGSVMQWLYELHN
jgi:Zn-finger nucleic acid-binding protein